MVVPAAPTVVTDEILEHRRRLGIDKSDERWDGEWHLVNPPKNWHSDLGYDLLLTLAPRARELGLRGAFERGVFGADKDWRVPDLVFFRPGFEFGEAGIHRAELVVEIRSPGDDSYKKLPFYADHAGEALILHRDRTPELYRPLAPGRMERVAPGPDGSVPCRALGVDLSVVAGPFLRITLDGGEAEI